jgi:hypothetical protein
MVCSCCCWAGADARHGRREAVRHAGTAPGRKLQAGGRAAGAGAQGPGRDADPGARRGLAQPHAGQRQDRGVFGEVQLGALLEQVFTPEQYATNVATVPGSRERVEFAVRLPGRGGPGTDDAPLWLPIDAKFPREDYERLLDAQERADKCRRRRAAGQGHGGTAPARGARHPRQVHRAAAHHRLRASCSAHRGPVRRGAAPPRADGGAAARAPRGAGRADHAAGHAQQPADGLSHAGAGKAQQRGVAGAGRGQDRVRQVRRRARWSRSTSWRSRCPAC